MIPYPEYEADKRYFELKLVQAAERFPDRVGLRGVFVSADGKDHCILGYIGGAHLLAVSRHVPWPERTHDFDDPAIVRFLRWGGRQPADCITHQAAEWNNIGMPWGQIPKLLGIVPGEVVEPVVEAVPEENVEVTA